MAVTLSCDRNCAMVVMAPSDAAAAPAPISPPTPPMADASGPAAAGAEGARAKKGLRSSSSSVTRGRIAAAGPPLIAAEPAEDSRSTLAMSTAADEAAEARELVESCRWIEAAASEEDVGPAAPPTRWRTPVWMHRRCWMVEC